MIEPYPVYYRVSGFPISIRFPDVAKWLLKKEVAFL